MKKRNVQSKIFKDVFFKKAQSKTVKLVAKKFLSCNEKTGNKKKILDLHFELCREWKVLVNLKVDERNYERMLVTGGSEFEPESFTVRLYLVSLVVYLHEFKHVLQFFYPEYRALVDPEEDAFDWAFAVIKQGLPRYYELIKKNSFFARFIAERYRYEVDLED